MEKGSMKGMLLSAGLLALAVAGGTILAHYINHHVLEVPTKVVPATKLPEAPTA
jgi:hypothetical protein